MTWHFDTANSTQRITPWLTFVCAVPGVLPVLQHNVYEVRVSECTVAAALSDWFLPCFHDQIIAYCSVC
jgi:hypothetical protein